MAKNRGKLTKAIRDAVLSEYNHLCSICGAVRPHIHHIDENPENHDPLNLLPLCPNHHLTDAHNPTKKMDPLKIGLFRRYKDPQILSPQFEPLFQRLRFLLVPFDRDEDGHALSGRAGDVVMFVEHFVMGRYYASRLRILLQWPQPKPYTDAEKEQVLLENTAFYRERLLKNREHVLELVVELLRYQTWLPFNNDRSSRFDPEH